MTIGRLAKAAGVGVETIRYYERIGLIERPSATVGYRVYGTEHVKQLKYIRNGKALRLSLDDIARLRAQLDHGVEFCSAVRTAVRQRLVELELQISTLVEDKAELTAFLARCSARPPSSPCPVLLDLNS